ncbi:MAG: cupredoxin domain-containing protein [Acidimicrobiia bacterium]|nr:cupredoxin domain-containing protein [Acidimicrobiia bacterium]
MMTPRRRRARTVAVSSIACLALLAMGCSGDDSTSSDDDGGSDAAAATVTVDALDNLFRPEVVEVPVGTEILWINQGRQDHDVVPVDDDEDWGVALADFTPGEEYRHTFTEPGEYRYYCTIHATPDRGMIGTIVVTE